MDEADRLMEMGKDLGICLAQNVKKNDGRPYSEISKDCGNEVALKHGDVINGL